MITAARLTLAAALTTAFLAIPTDLVSCGPFIPQAVFTAWHGPVNPGADYARGYVGIVGKEWRTEPLIVAWRYFSGLDLNAPERQSLYPAKREPDSGDSSDLTLSSMNDWLKARGTVPGAAPVQYVQTNRHISKADQYINFQNCLSSAFVTATATLTSRAATWGPASKETKDWLTAQDTVFSNCSGPDVKPAPASADAPALLQADRAYQAAAADFYAGDYTDAHKRFVAIANDTKSPWHANALYLAARATLRDGTVNNSFEKLAEAAEEFRKIKTPAAQELLDFAEIRLHRDERLTALANTLAQPRIGPNPKQTLADFKYIFLDMNTGKPKPSKASTPLLDWIQFWRNPPDAAAAIETWRKQRDTPWLIAALSAVPPRDPAAAELLLAAQNVPANDPAFPSVAFYAARAARPGVGRTWMNRALSLKLNSPDANQFLAARFAIARNFDDFLRDAPRKISLYSDIEDDPEPIEGTNRELRQYLNQRAFADDSVDLWNNYVPKAQWMAAAKGNLLPRNLRADLARTGWVRSALLDHADDAKAFLALWQELTPNAAKPAAAYRESPTPFTAARILLRNPGFSPFLRDGFGRLTPAGSQDEFRDNWWCPATPRVEKLRVPAFLPRNPTPESKALNRPASAFIPTEIVRYAKANPDDPANPELLARSLNVAHYSSCFGKATGAPSKEAFELLKTRYANTTWAQKTDYWYR